MADRTYRGPIRALRLPVAARWPNVRLPEAPEFVMPPIVLRDAACAGEDPELFFPDGPRSERDTTYAKTVCARCPVRAECLRWALDNRQEFGIWGGLDESERAALAGRSGEESAA